MSSLSPFLAICLAALRTAIRNIAEQSRKWLRGLDSNQNNQLQRLMSYQLDDPGVVG
jgi:hypothetical protein